MHTHYITQQKQQKKLGVSADLAHKLMLQFMFINVLCQQNCTNNYIEQSHTRYKKQASKLQIT